MKSLAILVILNGAQRPSVILNEAQRPSVILNEAQRPSVILNEAQRSEGSLLQMGKISRPQPRSFASGSG
jgi:hypothetical protein